MELDPKRAVIWIVSTGTEILQGHYPDKNAQWLSERMLEMGLWVDRHMALPDDSEGLREGLREAAARADLVLMSGGLGPTVDDLNRWVIAEIWGVELEEHAETIERIRERFRRHGRTMPESNKVQALMPRGAAVLRNDNGTAPGFYLKPAVAAANVTKKNGPRATIVAMPGPPRELHLMFENQVMERLLEQFGMGRRRLRTLTFHTVGLPESTINELIGDLDQSDPKVNLAMLAKLGQVDIRLTLMGESEEDNAALKAAWRGEIRRRIGEEYIYGEDAETLEGVVGRFLRERGEWLATAESCTGGLLAARVTDAAGSSEYFREGFVTYANAAKIARLGVAAELIERHGAVSAEVAEAMAVGAARVAGAEWAVAITGIAGPGGGQRGQAGGAGVHRLGRARRDGPGLAAQFFGQSRRHPLSGGSVGPGTPAPGAGGGEEGQRTNYK